MNHTPATPQASGQEEPNAPAAASLANPQRTRVGADGSPIAMPGPASGN